MSDTIAVVDEEKQNSIMDDAPPSSIANSKAYNKIAPWVLISLGTFYMSFLLYRYCSWRFRRRRVKRVRMERQKVDKFWRKRTACINALTEANATVPPPLQAAAAAAFDEEKYVQNWSPSFDSSATLVGIVSSSDYYMSEPTFTASSSVQQDGSRQQQEELLDEEQEAPYNTKHYNTMRVYSQQSTANRNTALAPYKQQRRKSRRERLLSTIINRINGNHQRKKKRQLLWQWSVAMGYCRYHHGHDMNARIQRLLVEEKRQKSISNNSSIAEKESVAAAEDSF